MRGEAVLTLVLAAVLLIALAVRDDFQPPPTPTPPMFLLTVDGASIGAEIGELGEFWTIDGPAASITITNTTNRAAAADVAFRLVDGPCGRGQVVELRGADRADSIEIPAGGSVDVTLGSVPIGPFGMATIGATPVEPPCPPTTTDPRSIAFQLYELATSA